MRVGLSDANGDLELDAQGQQMAVALKAMKRGSGIGKQEPKGFNAEVFEVDSWHQCYALIKAAFSSLPATIAVDALRSAILGRGGHGTSTLTSRREEFAETHAVTVRTVQRLEDDAMPLLVNEIRNLLDPLSVRMHLLSVIHLSNWALVGFTGDYFNHQLLRDLPDYLIHASSPSTPVGIGGRRLQPIGEVESD